MKLSKPEYRVSLVIGLLLILAASIESLSQTIVGPTLEPPPPPKAEEFKQSSDIVVPWRDGDCLRLTGGRRNNSGCYLVTAAQYATRTTAAIYRDDATVWLTFDLDHKHIGYFGKVTSVDFVPFATPGLLPTPPNRLVLRISGESENWYKVVVNEDTGTVGYIFKGDPDWWKTTFEYYLKGKKTFSPAKDFAPLLDAPNGKIIPESEFIRFERLEFIRLDKPDGEWAYVERVVDGKPYKGWIRWRDGRKFLVDCYFSLKKAQWLE